MTVPAVMFSLSQIERALIVKAFGKLTAHDLVEVAEETDTEPRDIVRGMDRLAKDCAWEPK